MLRAGTGIDQVRAGRQADQGIGTVIGGLGATYGSGGDVLCGDIRICRRFPAKIRIRGLCPTDRRYEGGAEDGRADQRSEQLSLQR
jgi:hypothetical protein